MEIILKKLGELVKEVLGGNSVGLEKFPEKLLNEFLLEISEERL